MTYPTTIEDYYNRIKELLTKDGFTVNPHRPIQYGIQFIVFLENQSGIIRLFDGKKGLKLDLSQVKEQALLKRIENHLSPIELESGKRLKFTSSIVEEKTGPISFQGSPKEDPDELIGIDESGKGDYFGPLVVASVYTNPTLTKRLQDLGVKDCKVLTDTRVHELAPQIEAICPHSLVVMANKSYNDVYEKVGNLNHILAWAHARVLMNTLNQVDCPYALSDQFGDPNLIRAQLYAKGKQVMLFSRPKAESNIAVAAASILARSTFLTYLSEMTEKFNLKIPKGSTEEAIFTAQKLITEHGSAILPYTVKLHFKLTQKLKT